MHQTKTTSQKVNEKKEYNLDNMLSKLNDWINFREAACNNVWTKLKLKSVNELTAIKIHEIINFEKYKFWGKPLLNYNIMLFV